MIEPRRRRFITRRGFLKAAAGCFVSAVGVLGYTTLVEPHWYYVERRTMAVRNLPPALQGKTMLHLSDLHLGDRVDANYLRDSLKAAQRLEPDLVVLTGDLVSHNGWDQADDIRRVYTQLPKAPLGSIAILGNHDYGLAWRDMEAANRVAGHMESIGTRVLRNEVTEVAGLQIAGIDDLWTEKFDDAAAMGKVDMERPAIVLCHNPDACDLDVWRGYEGWILAGHTHGGQCKPPFLAPPILPVKNHVYTQGEFQLT